MLLEELKKKNNYIFFFNLHFILLATDFVGNILNSFHFHCTFLKELTTSAVSSICKGKCYEEKKKKIAKKNVKLPHQNKTRTSLLSPHGWETWLCLVACYLYDAIPLVTIMFCFFYFIYFFRWPGLNNTEQINTFLRRNKSIFIKDVRKTKYWHLTCFSCFPYDYIYDVACSSCHNQK